MAVRNFCGMGGKAHVGGGAGGGPSTRCGMLRRLSSAFDDPKSTERWWEATVEPGRPGDLVDPDVTLKGLAGDERSE